jgi:SAM-dependent methyltransferase
VDPLVPLARLAANAARRLRRAGKRALRAVEHGRRDLARAGRRLRQHAARRARSRGRELRRGGGRWWRRLGGRRVESAVAWLDIRYRPPQEASACPACGSGAITHLDTLWHYRSDSSRYAGFVSGCRTCGLVFANPFPASDVLSQYYDGPGSAYAARKSAFTEAHAAPHAPDDEGVSRKWPVETLFATIRGELDVLSPPPGARMLDFGCGPGRLLDVMQRHGWETCGIEPAMKVAFTRHRELDAPPTQPAFHLITANHVLEHVADPLQVLRTLAAALVDGGFLYVSVPRLDAVAVHGDLKYCINAHRHIVAYTATCLEALFAMAGLTAIALRNDAELDQALTGGRPLRQRLLARKTGSAPPVPVQPLEPAARALRAFRARQGWRGAALAVLVPVRLRANWMHRRQQAEIAAHRRRKDGRKGVAAPG